MEKEKVLEIEIKKINDDFSVFYPVKMDIEKLKELIKKSGDGYYKIKIRNGKIIDIKHEKNILKNN